MAKTWITLRTRLNEDPKVFRIASVLNTTPEEIVFALYCLAGWFAEQGKYGKVKTKHSIVDAVVRIPGFADLLLKADWLRDHGGVLTVHGFCDVSAGRKSLGRKIRRMVLDGASCAACGTERNLVIDHIIPIARGGSCELSNLQALCDNCNRRKGRKTMKEFMA